MKRFLSFTVMMATAIAIGQSAVTPEATVLLEKAKNAHGGIALDAIKTYEETDVLIPTESATTLKYKINFANECIRLEVSSQKKLQRIQQFCTGIGSIWTQDTGTVVASKAESDNLRIGLYIGATGMKFGLERDAASTTGKGKIGDLQGDLVTVTTKGFKTSILLDTNGVLLAEQIIDPEFGTQTLTYSDLRNVDGIILPFTIKSHFDNSMIEDSEFQASDIKINPKFTEKDFEMPKK
jgi:hypothetical protein